MRRTPKSVANKPAKSALNKSGRGAAPRPGHFLLAAAALCALVGGAYANSLANGFVWDDLWQIVVNPAVQGAAPLAKLIGRDAQFPNFDPASQPAVYRPLQMV